MFGIIWGQGPSIASHTQIEALFLLIFGKSIRHPWRIRCLSIQRYEILPDTTLNSPFSQSEITLRCIMYSKERADSFLDSFLDSLSRLAQK